jgi:iron complex outermembrane receptor protein
MISNSVLTAICGAASGLAFGQTPQSPGALALDEVVVTSRRVEERLQDVPVSITALTSTDLERQAIRNVADLVNATPNLTYSSSVTGRTAVPVIRGIALIDERGFDNAVGIFIDGIFVSGRAAQNVGMLDLERVEVIKGPQSALYGRNTFSGAINYVTRPTPDEFTARVEATLGSDSLTRINGSIGGPVTEWFGARLAASYEDDKGTYRNSGPLGVGNGIGGIESKSALLSLRFTPADNLSIELGGYYSEEFADSLPLNLLPNNCGQFSRTLNPSATSSDLANPLYFCGEGRPNGSGFLSMSPDAFSFDGETRRGTVSIAWELPGVTIQSLSAYTTTKNVGAQDLDRTQTGDTGYGYLPLSVYRAFGSPSFICSGFIPVGPCAAPNGGTAPLFNQIRSGTFNTYFGIANLDTDYVSSELRFTGSRDQRLRWLGGLFYFRSKNDDTTTLGIDASSAATALGLPTSQIQFLILDRGSIIPGLAPNGIAVRSPVYPPNAAFRTDTDVTTLTWSPLVDRQKAVFGSLEFDFTDTLTGTAELRYTKESQQVRNAFDIFFFATGSASTESTFTDPRLTLRWKPSDELMVYASAARGTRSGGLNQSVTDPALASFDEETNNTYEIGVKASFADGRLQLNASAFRIDWKDAQFRQTVPSSTPGAILTATTNAGDLESTGLELQAAARLTEAWTLEANLGLANPKFGSNTFAAGEAALCRTLPAASSPYPVINVNCVARDIDGNGTIDATQPEISGKQLRRTSKVTANLALEYARPVFGDSRLVARVDANYRSKQYQDFSNLQYVPSRMLANLRVGLERENYDVILWVENLTDEDALAQTATVFSQSFNSLSSITSGVNIPQRRYGVTARYRF